MKCKNCGMRLNYCYYLIAGLTYCKSCALEMIGDIQEFKHLIPNGKTYFRGDKNVKKIH